MDILVSFLTPIFNATLGLLETIGHSVLTLLLSA